MSTVDVFRCPLSLAFLLQGRATFAHVKLDYGDPSEVDIIHKCFRDCLLSVLKGGILSYDHP